MPFPWFVVFSLYISITFSLALFVHLCDRVRIFHKLECFQRIGNSPDAQLYWTFDSRADWFESFNLYYVVRIQLEWNIEFPFILSFNFFYLIKIFSKKNLFSSHQLCWIRWLFGTKGKNQNVVLNAICNVVDCTLFKIPPKPIKSIQYGSLENLAAFLAIHAF